MDYWQSLRLLVTALALHCAPVVLAESVIGALTFDYESGSYSEEFVDWFAEYSIKQEISVAASTTLEELVEKQCGPNNNVNLRLYRSALTSYRISEEKQTAYAPKCLPTTSLTFKPKFALAEETDTISYLANIASAFNEVNLLPPNSPSVKFTPAELATDLYSKYSVEGIGFQDLRQAVSGADSGIWPFAPAWQLPQSAEFSKNDALTQYWSSTNIPLLFARDTEEIAFGLKVAELSMREAGYEVSMVELAKAGVKAKALPAGVDLAAIASADRNINERWTPDLLKQTALYADRMALVSVPAGNELFDRIEVLSPSSAAQISVSKIRAKGGDVVIAPYFSQQKAVLPIDISKMALNNVAAPPKILTDREMQARVISDKVHLFAGLTDYECETGIEDNYVKNLFGSGFMAALQRTRVQSVKDDLKVSPVDILIADTGYIHDFSSELPMHQFLKERIQDANRPSGNLETTKRIHGTSVALLAVGGHQLWPLSISHNIDLKISPANVFKGTGGGELVLDGDALVDIADVSADVFNMSFGSTDEDLMFKFKATFMRKGSGKLFVFAAGNNHLNNGQEGVDISESILFPHEWATGEGSTNVLIVAAMDGSKLAKFSNYSINHISLAAPGCNLDVLVPDENNKYKIARVSGTSFSAPIVSYVAALLKALSPNNYSSPAWLRARIIASADMVSTDLIPHDKIEHGRLLNATNAISIFDDIVEVIEEGKITRLQGELQWAKDVRDFCIGSPLSNRRSALRLGRLPSADGISEYYLYFFDESSRTLKTKKCNVRESGYLTIKTNDNQTLSFKMSNIANIIFSYEN